MLMVRCQGPDGALSYLRMHLCLLLVRAMVNHPQAAATRDRLPLPTSTRQRPSRP